MDSKFVKTVIIFPLVAAIVIALVFYLFLNGNIKRLTPISNGTQIMYHDELNPSNNPAKDTARLERNDLVGMLNGRFALRYDCDYSSLMMAGSLLPDGAQLGEIGTAYVEITENNSGQLDKRLSYSGVFGDLKYELKGEESFPNEEEILLIAPKAERSLVVYYLEKGNNGLSSEYKALIYEEVR